MRNDTCMRAWNAIPPEKPRSLEAHLVRITRNLALDRYAYHHSQKRETALTEAYEELEACLPLAKDGPEEAAMVQELQRTLNDFLRAQPEDARRFFLRRYWYGESIAEIAGPAAQAPGASAARCSAPARGSAGGLKRREYFYEAGRSVFPPDARRGRRSARGGHAAGAPPQARLIPLAAAACLCIAAALAAVPLLRAPARQDVQPDGTQKQSGTSATEAAVPSSGTSATEAAVPSSVTTDAKAIMDLGYTLAVPADSQDVVYSLSRRISTFPWRRYAM